MWTHTPLPRYLPLKETLLQSIAGVTVYHYCPWAIMAQIEGFGVKHSIGGGTRRVVYIGPRGRAGAKWESMFLKEPHVCMFMLNYIVR